MEGYTQAVETTEQEPSWYEVTIAGMQFNIASRKGEAHIREVERLLSETYGEVVARVEGQPPLNIALLTALNMADQLLEQKNSHNGSNDLWNERVASLVTRLGDAVEGVDEAPAVGVRYGQD